jgi:hypothetical protein
MNVRDLKNIMKEVNEPNEFILEPYDLLHPLYWIYKIDNLRVKTLYKTLEKFRKPTARFDVFINGLFISENDYKYENVANTFYIKFIRKRFPEFDRFGNPYGLETTDVVKINGDIEIYR